MNKVEADYLYNLCQKQKEINLKKGHKPAIDYFVDSLEQNIIQDMMKYISGELYSIRISLNNIDYYTSWCRDFHDDPSYKENMTSILTEKLIERNIRDFRLSFDRHDYINQGIVIYGSIIIEI
jgi:hypothetical protein